MEELKPLQPLVEEMVTGKEADGDEGVDEGVNESEEPKPMPFGVLGIAFICALTQYAAFLGFTMIILMLIHYFGPK